MGGFAGGKNQTSSGELSGALDRLFDPNRNAFINAPVMTPDYGASKYYYVDPRAKTDQQRQNAYDDEQGHTDDTDHGFVIDAVLRRLQTEPQQQQIGF